MRRLIPALIFCTSAHIAAASSCPSSCIWWWAGDLESHCQPDAVIPTTCSAPAGSGGGCFAYDLIAGIWSASAPSGNAIGGASARIRDDYTLVGPVTAQPVAITARMHVISSLWYGCFEGGRPELGGTLTSSTGPHVEWYYGYGTVLVCGGNEFDENFDLPLVLSPGVPFRLTLDLKAAGAYSDILANGRLLFPDLPSGYSIVSCQGFTTSTVAVQQTTWTLVKRLYRD